MFSKFKRYFLIIMSFIVFFSAFFCMDFTFCYALSYNNENIGITDSLDNIKDVDKNINKKLKNGNINIEDKINYSYIISPLSSIDTTNELSDSIIETTDKIQKEYGLIVNDKVYYTSSVKEVIENKIGSLIDSYKKETLITNCYVADYKIEEGYYIQSKYTDNDIIKALKIDTNTEKTEIKKVKIKYNTVKQIDYTRIGTERKILQEGRRGVSVETYKNTYFDGNLISSQLLTKKIKRNPQDKIVSIPFKKSKSSDSLQEITTTREKFINQIIPTAIQLYKENNILPSLTVAQAILESAWGECHIGNNIYGIKAYGDWNGKKSYVWTSEQNKDGSYERIKCWFKNYDSFEDSVKDYGELLSTNNYNLVRTAKNYRDAVAAVRICGYATSLGYVDNVIALIEKHHLYIWDKVAHEVNIKQSAIQQKWNAQLEKIKKEEKEKKKQEEKEKNKKKKIKENKNKKTKKTKISKKGNKKEKTVKKSNKNKKIKKK